MLRRLSREESGMTMALAIIMIVLIGVMGAGLLVFVQRDLDAVIEVNRGLTALEASDSGVQAARRQLLAISFPSSYDATAADNSEWAYNSASTACSGLGSGPGKCVTFPNGSLARITIRYLPPPTSSCGSVNNPNCAPEPLPSGATDYQDGRDFFLIESDGLFSGARRRIQAIYRTEDIGLPKTYFATGDINLGGSTTISNVSLFSKRDVNGLRENMLTGVDSAYGNWLNSTYNNKAKLGNATRPANAPGVGAERNIAYDPASYNSTQKSAPAESSDRYKRLDFDGSLNLSAGPTPTAPTPNYVFCAKDNVLPPCS